MSALDLQNDSAIPFEEVPLEVTKEFVSRFSTSDSLRTSDWWKLLLERLDAPGLESFREIADVLESEGDIDALPVSAWHGDWSPWNMGRVADGRLGVWDWERTSVGAPTGLDSLHLHYQYGEEIHAAISDLRALGVPVEHHRILKVIYLLELAARHGEAGVLDSGRQVAVAEALGKFTTAQQGGTQ